MNYSYEDRDFREDTVDLPEHRSAQHRDKQIRQAEIRRGIEDYLERKDLAYQGSWYDFE